MDLLAKVNEMILIYVNGNLIENMIIQDNMLLFSDVDEKDNTIYKTTPINEYEKESNKYLQVESILYGVLGFEDESNINAFKELCIKYCSNGDMKFNYEDLDIVLEQIEDNEDIVIV